MPVESVEVQSLKMYMSVQRVPYRVTSTNTGLHVATSYHYAQGTAGIGLAVDYSGLVPSRNSQLLLDIYHALCPLIATSYEVFYGGPGGGMWVNGSKITDEALRKQHEDHVHIAVRRGFRFTGNTTIIKGVKVPEDNGKPDYKVNAPPIGIAAVADASGQLTGYIILGADGGVFTFEASPGKVPYLGRVHV